MKKLSFALALTLMLIFELGISYGQSPTYLWAKQQDAGGTSGDESYSVATNINGNILVTGFFKSPTITFGTTTLTNTDSTGNTNDIFIVKYDAGGNVLWAKSAGGTDNDEGYSIAADVNGNIIVTGNFMSSSIIFGTDTLSNAGDRDIFIVKYDAGGNVLWAKSAGETYDDDAYSVATDLNGNIVVAGCFFSYFIIFGTDTLTAASSAHDMFVVKYDAAGNVLWAKQQDAGGTGYDYGYSVATDTNGNILVTGYFDSSPIIFGTDTLISAGGGDMFIVKYDTDGNVLWAKNAGGNDLDEGTGVATDANGNILVTGYFTSPSIIFGTDTLTNAGSYDMFIVKYDSAGNALWARRQDAGGTDPDMGKSIATDANGNIFVVGRFLSSSITFGTDTLTNAGSYDVFIVKYDSAGNALWAKSAGGNDYDWGYSITTDANGNILVTGFFNSFSITFGTITLTNAYAGHGDMFIVKLCTIPTQPGSISGDTTVCEESTNTYSITAVSGATSYTWTLPPGWTGTSTTNSITATANSTSGNITVTANSNCGSSSAQTLYVTINPLPIINLDSTSDAINGVCNGYIDVNVTGSSPFTYSWSTGGTADMIEDLCAGDYIANVIDNIGCFSQDTFSIQNTYDSTYTFINTINATIDTCIFSTSQPVDSAFITSFQILSPDSAILTWEFWQGGSSVTIDVDVNYVSGYNLVYFEVDCSTKATSIYKFYGVFNSLATDVQKIDNIESLRIFPNPARSKLNVITNGAKQSVSIYNLQGQLLLQENIKQDKIVFDISNLAKGLYILKVTGNKDTAVTKFVKE